jgi:hypothetical protein
VYPFADTRRAPGFSHSSLPHVLAAGQTASRAGTPCAASSCETLAAGSGRMEYRHEPPGEGCGHRCP